MSKHTPGPWIDRPDPSSNQGDHPHGDYVIGIGEAIDLIAVVGGKANAALVAQAPALLESLKHLLARAETELADAADVWEVQNARAAIAKATGEQP